MILFFLIFGIFFAIVGIAVCVLMTDRWYIGLPFVFSGIIFAILGPISNKKKMGSKGCKIACFTQAEEELWRKHCMISYCREVYV